MRALWASCLTRPLATRLAAGVHSLLDDYQSYIVASQLNLSTAIPEKISI